ncbi:MAG: HipA domain-containing protein [Bacteroidales bacterium]|nr:HipA domain-containing protein [Bacteroidales bacterium]
MNLPVIKYCPGTLAEGFNTYSPGCLRNMFQGKSVHHILPYESPEQNDEVAGQFMENRKRISISGVQEKLSFILDKNVLRLSKEREQGTYILKPIPRDLKRVTQVPANEHLTMQVARQIYGIHTAENALVFFRDGSSAYLTKRFDVKPQGGKWGKEDFASLAGKTKDNAGEHFKYDYSYEEIGLLIQQYVPAWRVEIEKYYALVVFNFLFSNGDAHLKNFSLVETSTGDYILSPAYDLLDTRIHVDEESFFALSGDLFKEWNWSGCRITNSQHHPCKEDFTEFGKSIGINNNRVVKLLEPFLKEQHGVASLVSRSYLDDDTKALYIGHYRERLAMLNLSGKQPG